MRNNELSLSIVDTANSASKSVRGITIGRLTHRCHPRASCYCSFLQMLSKQTFLFPVKRKQGIVIKTVGDCTIDKNNTQLYLKKKIMNCNESSKWLLIDYNIKWPRFDNLNV